MIELKNFTYKTNKILFDGASFKAPSTGMIGIAGESGCGKTTFLKIISKQIHVDSMVIIRKEQHRQSHKVHHLYHQLHH